MNQVTLDDNEIKQYQEVFLRDYHIAVPAEAIPDIVTPLFHFFFDLYAESERKRRIEEELHKYESKST